MLGGVKFVTGSCIALTNCHLSYNPYHIIGLPLVAEFCRIVGCYAMWSKVCVGDNGVC